MAAKLHNNFLSNQKHFWNILLTTSWDLSDHLNAAHPYTSHMHYPYTTHEPLSTDKCGHANTHCGETSTHHKPSTGIQHLNFPIIASENLAKIPWTYLFPLCCSIQLTVQIELSLLLLLLLFALYPYFYLLYLFNVAKYIQLPLFSSSNHFSN